MGQAASIKWGAFYPTFILITILIAVQPASSQQSGNSHNPELKASPAATDLEATRLKKVVGAVRITETISLDGHLDEPAWNLAVPATDFIQHYPHLYAPASDPTEVRILYDDENLYFGVICFDSDAPNIVVREMTEDFSLFRSDIISLILDTLNDDRSGFNFITNPAGAMLDGQIANDGQWNGNWDGVWDVNVSTNGQGWIAEFRIPFKTLRFSQLASQEWGFNVTRAIRSRNEESVWAPVPLRYRATRVSLAGTLKGLDNIRQGMNLKIKPFITGGFTQTRASVNPAGRLESDRNFDGGVDVKYSLTPSLTLDGTYRTDFAQVEVDQQQVNLTRFSLFFPEKRDFFLENSGTFAVGGVPSLTTLSPFFSRRIGLSNSGAPIPITGGARLSGKVGAYDVGFLTMKTEKQDTTPSDLYLVGRIKRNFLANSYVGAIVTHRGSTIEGVYNRVFGADAFFQFYDRLEFNSYLLISDTPAGSAFFGRQADTSGKNQAKKFEVAWRDEELEIAASYHSVQDHFNAEVGFIPRRDITQYSGEFAWKPILESSDSIRNLHFSANVDYFDDVAGTVETREQAVTLGIQFQNNGSASFSINNTFDRLKDPFTIRREVLSNSGGVEREGVAISPGDYTYLGYSAAFSTDQSKVISGNGNFDWGEFWDGNRKSFIGGLNLMPNHHLNISFNYRHDRVALKNGRFTTDLVGARFVYAFSPRAFLHAFIQYNTDTQQISSNIRFNLIHHPRSDLFLVYYSLRDTNTGRPVERAFTVKITNLFAL